MIIKKAFTNNKNIKDFKDKYSNGDIDTEVISNMLQPFHEDKYPVIKEYCDFWWPKDKTLFGLTGVLQLNITRYGAKALEEAFGKYDFTFDGNRTYKNYILEFDGLIIIAPDKRTVVLPKTKGIREKLVEFEKTYSQFVLDYVFRHYDELKDFEKDSLQKMKEVGILDHNNQIDFDYAKKPINKVKIK
jgi:hypothetical protein